MSSPTDVVAAEAVEDQFDTEQIVTISGAHFVHDSYSAFVAPLLPMIQERFGIGYALAGGLQIFIQLPSLLNPFIGYLADKISLRYFIIFAPALSATLFSAMGLANNYVTLAIILFAAGISVAAFHAPAPAMIGALSGNKTGRAMSIWMAGGELGRTLGPLLAAAAIGWFAFEELWRVSFIGWLVSLILWWRLKDIKARPGLRRPDSMMEVLKRGRVFFSMMGWLMLARVFITSPITTYLPLFMTDVLDVSEFWLSAGSLSTLEAAGFVGALVAGTMSDKFGRSRVLLVLLAAAPALLLIFLITPSWAALPMLLLIGFAAIAPTPVLMAWVQDEFQDNRALANGVFLGINFVMRSLGVAVVGLFADQFGLFSAFLWSGLIGFLAIPPVLMLMRRTTDKTQAA